MLLINSIGFVFSIFLGSLLFIKGVRKEASAFLSGALMIIFSLLILNSIRILYWGPSYLISYELISNHLLLLIGPLLFFNTKARTNDFHCNKSIFIHFIPITLLLPLNLILQNGNFLPAWNTPIEILSLIFLIFSLPVYLLYSLRIIRTKKEKFPTLWWTLIGFIIVWTFNLVFQIFDIFQFSSNESMPIFATLLLSFLIIVLTYQQWYLLLRTVYKPKSSLKVKKQDQIMILKAIQELMATQKPYLDPSFSLSDLSQSISFPSSYISVVINTEFGISFKKYLGKLRVKEFIILASDRKKNLSIMGLAQEAGFRSTSTFNISFKEYMGILPSEYIKSL